MWKLGELRKRAKFESDSKIKRLRKILPRRSGNNLKGRKLHLWLVRTYRDPIWILLEPNIVIDSAWILPLQSTDQ